jgi:hypothetical protein
VKSTRLQLAKKLAKLGHIKSARALIARELAAKAFAPELPLVVIEVNRKLGDK